jgi:beta-barrel assembly-enhancing protease
MKHHRGLLIFCLAFLLSVFPLGAQENQTIPAQVFKNKKSKGPAEKDDIQAIGTRNIGKKGLGNWYSLKQEIGIGREYADAIEAHTKPLQDPIVTEYVNRIGQNLVRNSDAQVPFSIKVIDSDVVNAFALPGGFLYVNSGLILAADDEAELAGVMAHEIAHVAARHATRQMTRSEIFNLVSISLIFLGGGVGFAVEQATGLAIPLSMMKFSRGFESEADYLGVEYLYKAGYDPQAFISFFERVQAQEKQKPGLMAKAFSDHPQTGDRVRKTQTEIVRILPAREAYVVSTSEFDEVKSRLAPIETRHQSNMSIRPTLRHRPPANDSDSKGGHERPTLKRQSN